MLTGSSLEISASLQYDWYKPFYYRQENNSFPSNSAEQLGHFVGLSKHVGHALTYKILAKDSQKIIYRSVIHSAIDPNTRNFRADDNVELHGVIGPYLDDGATKTQDGERAII